MRIVVFGAGTVGTWIAGLLCRNRHRVTVVDSSAANTKQIDMAISKLLFTVLPGILRRRRSL